MAAREQASKKFDIIRIYIQLSLSLTTLIFWSFNIIWAVICVKFTILARETMKFSLYLKKFADKIIHANCSDGTTRGRKMFRHIKISIWLLVERLIWLSNWFPINSKPRRIPISFFFCLNRFLYLYTTSQSSRSLLVSFFLRYKQTY